MKENKLNILWTNDNPITAEHMVMMYSKNAMLQRWWKDITVIIWGATAKLIAEDSNIQKLIKDAQKAGVEFVACLACASNLGTVDKLTDLGIDLKYMGVDLTNIIKEQQHLITI